MLTARRSPAPRLSRLPISAASSFSALALCVASCAPSPPPDIAPAPRPTPSALPAAPSALASASAAPPPSQEPSAPPPPAEPPLLRARFLSVGDVMVGRRVQKAMDAKGDVEHPFHPFAKLYADVDFTFANLENPLFSGKKPNVTPPGKRYAVLWAKPEHAKTLVKYKFTAVNLANNHAMDQDLRGLKETIATLDAEKIQHVGTGPDLNAAWTPMIVDDHGIKIGFVGASFCSKNDMGYSRNNYVARIEDEDRLAAAIKKAREAGAHFVVATMHAGDEHKHALNDKQKAFAKAAVRAGADIVIGAHPHVVQPAGKIDGKWVFYSLGNFVFDQPAYDNSEGLAVEIFLTMPPGAERATLDKLVLHPVWIEDSAPGPADDEHAAKILWNVGVKDRELAP